jgi:hypothetical protein
MSHGTNASIIAVNDEYRLRSFVNNSVEQRVNDSISTTLTKHRSNITLPLDDDADKQKHVNRPFAASYKQATTTTRC